jgi:hypothetical protein
MLSVLQVIKLTIVSYIERRAYQGNYSMITQELIGNKLNIIDKLS